MNIENLKYLVSPVFKKQLKLKASAGKKNKIISGSLIDAHTLEEYRIGNGIINISYPPVLTGLDSDFNAKYEINSQFYNEGMKWLFGSFYEKEEDVRKKLIAPLRLRKNSFVLNISCGTGGDLKYILKELGDKGKLFNLDLTAGLLQIARKKFNKAKSDQEFIVANASYLPFRDNVFDCVFHFGGINVFSEKKKAIDEMVRVTKPNGRIVFGDESVAPWLNNKLFGKIIKNANPLYKHKPPIHMLPSNAQDVSVEYLLGNSFYLISFTKGKEAALNLDLEIPGKRGGTLRSRYEKAINNKISK